MIIIIVVTTTRLPSSSSSSSSVQPMRSNNGAAAPVLATARTCLKLKRSEEGVLLVLSHVTPVAGA